MSNQNITSVGGAFDAAQAAAANVNVAAPTPAQAPAPAAAPAPAPAQAAPAPQVTVAPVVPQGATATVGLEIPGLVSMDEAASLVKEESRTAFYKGLGWGIAGGAAVAGLVAGIVYLCSSDSE